MSTSSRDAATALTTMPASPRASAGTAALALPLRPKVGSTRPVSDSSRILKSCGKLADRDKIGT